MLDLASDKSRYISICNHVFDGIAREPSYGNRCRVDEGAININLLFINRLKKLSAKHGLET